MFRSTTVLLAALVWAVPLRAGEVDEVLLGASEYLDGPGHSGQGVTTGDIDGNGLPDIVVCRDWSGGSVDVSLARCEGGFEPPTVYEMGSGCRRAVAVDLNGDGLADVASANEDSDTIAIRWGSPTGALGPSQVIPVDPQPREIDAADLDGDGDLDLIVACFTGGSLALLRNDGSGNFDTEILATLVSPSVAVGGDLNGDGDADVAVIGAFGDVVYVYLSTGNGLGPAQEIDLESVVDIAICDLDGDGAQDLVAAVASDPGRVAFFWGLGDGTFTTGELVDGSLPLVTRLRIGDMDGDGVQDLALRAGGLDGILTYRGVGNRQFEPGGFAPTFQTPRDFCLADLDSDQRDDLLMVEVTNLFRFPGMPDIAVPHDGISFPPAWRFGRGDFNGDRNPDFVFVDEDVIKLYYADGMGGFETGPTFSAPGTPRQIRVLDVDLDGDDDFVSIFTEASGITHVLVFRTGEITPITDYPLPVFGTALITGDLNADDRPDVVVPHFLVGGFSVLLSTPSGVYLPPVAFDTTLEFGAGAIGDVNHDQIADLVLDRSTAGGFQVFLGDGSGGFLEQPFNAAGNQYILSVFLSDVDLDGNLDLVSNTVNEDLAIFLGVGDGTFPSMWIQEGGLLSDPRGLAVTDFDGDGFLDFVLEEDRYLFVCRGLGGGAFEPAQIWVGGAIQAPLRSALLEDVDLDGDLDYLTFDFLGQVRFLMNRSTDRPDCNGNGLLDGCDAAAGTLDCDGFLRGDANLDGGFDIADAVRTLEYLFSQTWVGCEVALDTNDDETLNIADAVYSLGALFDGGPPPAAPFPDCGADPTPGDLSCDQSACP